MSNIPKRPRLLLNAIIGLYVQVVLNAAGGVLFLYLAGVEADRNREAPELTVIGYLSIAVAVTLLGGVILVTRGVPWARIPIAVIESVGILSGLIALVTGALAGVANLALCMLVLITLFRRDVNDWFDEARAVRSGQ